MAQGEEPHIEVRLKVNQVPYRSAAWRELWRQIFEAVAAELAAEPGHDDGASSAALPDDRAISEPT